MKHVLYTTALAAATLTGCGGMDETYKEFRGDGPIVYLSKFPETSIRMMSGKKRLKMVLPPLTDARIAKGEITWWSTGTDHTQSFDVKTEGTEVTIDAFVDEGNYVFSLTLYDATGKYSSLPATLNGVTYGDTYESLLTNRQLISAKRNGIGTMEIVFAPVEVPPLAATQVYWKVKGVWKDTTIYPQDYNGDGSIDSPDKLEIVNFSSDSLAYCAIFKPDTTFIDEDKFVTVRRYESGLGWTN
jgi:hypothetical protein